MPNVSEFVPEAVSKRRGERRIGSRRGRKWAAKGSQARGGKAERKEAKTREGHGDGGRGQAIIQRPERQGAKGGPNRVEEARANEIEKGGCIASSRK